MVATLNQFFEPLKSDKSYAILFVSVILILMVKIYEGDASFFIKYFSDGYTNKDILQWHTWLYHHLASLLLFFIVPLFIIKVFLKDNFGNYGMGLGDVKFGLSASLVAIIILPILVYQNSLNPHHADFYKEQFTMLLMNLDIVVKDIFTKVS